MCYVLYAGTERPLAQSAWKKEAPCVYVEALAEQDRRVTVHFTKPIVQYIGSTSGCGCDFPFWTAYNSAPPDPSFEERDAKQIDSDSKNARELVDILRASGESSVELYGLWNGNESEPRQGSEEISLERILERTFRLREQFFYRVVISQS